MQKFQDHQVKLSPYEDWTLMRILFPVAENFIYFNHASIAPIPLSVKDKINECLSKYCDNGIVCNREFMQVVEDVRLLAAKMINASPTEIAFVKNTTQGIQIAANGIHWEKVTMS